MTVIDMALFQVRRATEDARIRARSLNGICQLLEGMEEPTASTMAVEALAMLLLPLDLCIVHRHTALDCLRLIEENEDEMPLSNDARELLQKRMKSALKGCA